jgi:hypothetical protein
MADWATISSLATAGGTLVLAAATFTAVRSSNRSARVAERALLAGMRPVLVPSRLEDPDEKVLFADIKWFRVGGGHALVEFSDNVVFLVIGVRNVGTGLGVLRAWRIQPHVISTVGQGPPPTESFRLQTRDIYLPAGAPGFWQGALRDSSDPDCDWVVDTIAKRKEFTIDILYGDGEGGQRVISRFAVVPAGDDQWLASVSRHWNLDRADPR